MAHQESKTTESFNRLLLGNFLQAFVILWYVLSLHLDCKEKMHLHSNNFIIYALVF